MGEPTQRCVAHHGQQAQRGDRTNEEEAQADQGEGGGEPLILVALRGLVELAGGQDPSESITVTDTMVALMKPPILGKQQCQCNALRLTAG